MDNVMPDKWKFSPVSKLGITYSFFKTSENKYTMSTWYVIIVGGTPEYPVIKFSQQNQVLTIDQAKDIYSKVFSGNERINEFKQLQAK